MPNFPCEVEIPDEWCEGVRFAPRRPGETYLTPEPALAVPLVLIQRPHRTVAVPHDWRGFDRARFRHVLERMARGLEIDALRMIEVPRREFPPQPYPYLIENGFHRFYAATVLGFDHLPCQFVD